MSTFLEVFESAEDLRNRWRCRRAVEMYEFAEQLAKNDTEMCSVLHMKGVTLKMWGRLDSAREALELARGRARGDIQLGNVYRDLGDVLSLLGEKEEAREALEQSLECLEPDHGAWGMTMGFRARHLQRNGDLDGALHDYRIANLYLRQSGAPQLFNMVYWANALRQNKVKLRRVWWRGAFELCAKYGAWPHRLRLVALRYFGFRADNFIQKLLPLQRFVPFV